jgi:hypothetical protein
MFLYNLPARSSTHRVYVWRKLKGCGVLYWQHSVCILPDRSGFRGKFEQLKRDIEDRGGEASISTIQLPDPKEHEEVIARFRQQADEEYQEFLGQCQDFHAELKMEREASHFTFAELDENEAEFAKLRSWLPKIQERDFFGGSLSTKANRELAACKKDFDDFSKTIVQINERSLLKIPKKQPPKTRRRGKSHQTKATHPLK